MVIFFIVLGVILFLAFFFVIFFLIWYSLPQQKGKRGEQIVNFNLQDLGYVLKNYIIQDKMGHSHQIDSILINQAGVFVIEVKNYAGDIYGSDQDQKWTQVMGKGDIRNYFYNPVRQNKTHCYEVRKVLPKNVPVISLVVFVHDNIQFIESEVAIGLSDLRRKILQYPKTISISQVQDAVDILKKHWDLEITEEQHIYDIRRVQAMIEHNICPRCGGKLVLRHGKYGDFYGCENYPKCKFIKKINDTENIGS